MTDLFEIWLLTGGVGMIAFSARQISTSDSKTALQLSYIQ